MTDEELRKLDKDVAREVMGYDPCPCWFSFNTGPQGECERCGKRCALPYARSIAAAWQIVEKMRSENRVRVGSVTEGWCCQIGDSTATADTAPLTICLAALKAVRAGKPQVNA